MKSLFACFLFAVGSCASGDAIIKVKGSDTEVNLAVQFAESFHEVNETSIVSISGGGSGLGIASLINGNADIANSSRRINDEELELFKKKKIVLDSFVFAQDAIAFVVAKDLKLDTISTIDLAKVLSGVYKNWEALTDKKVQINIYGRQNNSGTHDFVKQRLSIDFTPYAKQMNGNAQIIEAIKTDHSGIGYVGAGYVGHGANTEIKVLYIKDGVVKRPVSPLDATSIVAGLYFFQRPLFQYYRRSSISKIKAFLQFENSDQGQQIIRTAGYYPFK
ncbi:MAG: substrate-binding domain-containing protein [Chitinophagaceae bacterium]|nr:substrate-binding domain-containing protein [Chitinophagaceae bacterium]